MSIFLLFNTVIEIECHKISWKLTKCFRFCGVSQKNCIQRRLQLCTNFFSVQLSILLSALIKLLVISFSTINFPHDSVSNPFLLNRFSFEIFLLSVNAITTVLQICIRTSRTASQRRKMAEQLNFSRKFNLARLAIKWFSDMFLSHLHRENEWEQNYWRRENWDTSWYFLKKMKKAKRKENCPQWKFYALCVYLPQMMLVLSGATTVQYTMRRFFFSFMKVMKKLQQVLSTSEWKVSKRLLFFYLLA